MICFFIKGELFEALKIRLFSIPPAFSEIST
jgi:hypothetical protein